MHLFSVFFSDRLAAEGSSGTEVLDGTPLRMPANPDFKSFTKMIAQVFSFIILLLSFSTQEINSNDFTIFSSLSKLFIFIFFFS